MTTNELIIKLKNVKDELKQKFGIEQIALFDSIRSFIKRRVKEDLIYV